MKKTNKKGFTIVELVIVIAVIAILAAVLIPTFTNVVKKAKISAAMQAARSEYELYLADNADHVTAGADLIIVSGDYAFIVDGGQFNATAFEKVTSGGTTVGSDTYSFTGYTVTGTPAAVTDYDESNTSIVIYKATIAAVSTNP